MNAALSSYDAFALKIAASGVLTDPWVDGEPRFRERPLVVPGALADAMYRASEAVAAVYHELGQLAADDPEALDAFFGLTTYQKAMWLASQPHWHGIARADVFVTDDGLAFTELNCDTPTGEAEAVLLGALVRGAHPALLDPNDGLEQRFLDMVDALAARDLTPDCAGRRTVALVYPTEFTEDLSLVRLYKRWFEARGYKVVLGSPYNLGWSEQGTLLFDVPASIVVRHYKTDWWGERMSVWTDDDLPDAEPLQRPLSAVLAGIADGRTTVINPFGAVLPQNKRSMAFMWEKIHRFSPTSQATIEKFIPYTSRLETLHEEQVRSQREAWVIKSDYGAEGDEVVVGRHVSQAEWENALAHARPGRWIAQRYFEAKTDADGAIANHGVYLVAGQAAGLYARVQRGPTDDHALSVPVLVEP